VILLYLWFAAALIAVTAGAISSIVAYSWILPKRHSVFLRTAVIRVRCSDGLESAQPPDARADAAKTKQVQRRAETSAHYQLADGSNLQVPRKSAMTGRTAASDHCSERPLWAGQVPKNDHCSKLCKVHFLRKGAVSCAPS
jgi:hypothetical protein